MQVVGFSCATCSEKILFQHEGTWCARCKSTFHKACEPSENSTCPGCRQNFQNPSAFFVRSRFCPVCMSPNEERLDKCVCCGAFTRWDTEADYQSRKAEIRAAARCIILLGILEVDCAAVLYLICALIVFTTENWFKILLPPIVLFIDGGRRIVAGGRFLHFE